jgi:hypothetical protein
MGLRAPWRVLLGASRKVTGVVNRRAGEGRGVAARATRMARAQVRRIEIRRDGGEAS